jgi:hypothetical protein
MKLGEWKKIKQWVIEPWFLFCFSIIDSYSERLGRDGKKLWWARRSSWAITITTDDKARREVYWWTLRSVLYLAWGPGGAPCRKETLTYNYQQSIYTITNWINKVWNLIVFSIKICEYSQVFFFCYYNHWIEFFNWRLVVTWHQKMIDSLIQKMEHMQMYQLYV